MDGIKVLTTQNVDLEYTPASVGDRLVATIIDDILYAAYAFAFFYLLNDPGTVNIMLFLVLPIMLYQLLCEVFLNGQSIGKKFMKTKILMLDGTPPSLGAYLLRWLFRLVDTVILYGLVALITAATNGRGQRLGDIAAGTAVVKLRPPIRLRHILPDTVEEGYEVQFSEVSLLTEKNIAIIRTVLRKGVEENNPNMVKYTASRVRQVMRVQTELSDARFLQTVLLDYAAING